MWCSGVLRISWGIFSRIWINLSQRGPPSSRDIKQHGAQYPRSHLCFNYVPCRYNEDWLQKNPKTWIQKYHLYNHKLKNIHFSFIMLVLFFVLIVAEIFYSFLTAGLPGVNASVTTAVFILTSLAIATTCMMVFYITFLPLRLKLDPFFCCIVCFRCAYRFYEGNLFSLFSIHPGIMGKPLVLLKPSLSWSSGFTTVFLVILFGAEITVNFSKKDALLLKGLFTRGASGGTTPKTLIKKFITKYDQGDTVFQWREKGDDMFCCRLRLRPYMQEQTGNKNYRERRIRRWDVHAPQFTEKQPQSSRRNQIPSWYAYLRATLMSSWVKTPKSSLQYSRKSPWDWKSPMRVCNERSLDIYISYQSHNAMSWYFWMSCNTLKNLIGVDLAKKYIDNLCWTI